MDYLLLNHLTTVTYDSWLKSEKNKIVYRLFLTVSGYEKRCTHFISEILKSFIASELTDFVIIGFHKLKDKLNRPNNDEFYKGNKLNLEQLPADEWDIYAQQVQLAIQKLKRKAGVKAIEVHIDYSSKIGRAHV
jgi:hypothetical protein